MNKLNSAIILTVLPLTTSIFAQQWSAEQQEVWKNVQTYLSLDEKRDLDGFMEYFDDSYSGWGHESGAPMNKEAVKRLTLMPTPMRRPLGISR